MTGPVVGGHKVLTPGRSAIETGFDTASLDDILFIDGSTLPASVRRRDVFDDVSTNYNIHSIRLFFTCF